jgi:chromosomal replication initiation ATPase DnaA
MTTHRFQREIDLAYSITEDVLGTPREVLDTGDTRLRYIAHARDLVRYLLRKYTPLTGPEVAAVTGRSDHIGVTRAVRRVEAVLAASSDGTNLRQRTNISYRRFYQIADRRMAEAIQPE